jgi:16S rRNA processing protein RimM
MPSSRSWGRPEFLAVGRIVKPHGIRGEVAVEVLTDAPGRISPGAILFLEGEQPSPVRVEAVRPHQGRLLVRLEGVRDRDTAEAMRGKHLLLPFSQARQLGPDEYWPFELVGMKVVVGGKEVGEVCDVRRGRAHDLWVVRGPEGEFMVPAAAAFVLSVDREARVVEVADVPGLLEGGLE